jgi:hypothetical protein
MGHVGAGSVALILAGSARGVHIGLLNNLCGLSLLPSCGGGGRDPGGGGGPWRRQLNSQAQSWLVEALTLDGVQVLVLYGRQGGLPWPQLV